MFGPHLIIDGSRCDTRKLADRILVEQVLSEYPTAIGMTKIGGPYMFEYQAPDPAYSGVSGLVVIAESHIAIHTFPELDYFTMDIFSCKNFDHEKAIEYIKNAFDVREMDRMLVQRGLSFRGPHHGKHGATDELIAAADARLAAGIVSKEPALPDELASALLPDRAAATARRVDVAAESHASAGQMIWPQYGNMPDYGTYGAHVTDVVDERGGRSGAKIVALGGDALVCADGRTLPPTQPVQGNPTASISGLLDKLCAAGGEGRKTGRGLALWEQLARDADTTIALALSSPVIASGMRELLVYAVEHRYVDVVVASGADLFADLYEALGYEHYLDGERVIASDEGIERTRSFLAGFVKTLDASAVETSADFWCVLGKTLPTRAPRKGLLQAAAHAGVPVFAPDLSTGAVGSILLAARMSGASVPVDVSADVVALAGLLAERPRLGMVRVGAGAADALLAQARDVAPALGLAATTLSASVTMGALDAVAPGDHHVALATDATLALPLLVTGLAQRVPGTRRVSFARTAEPLSTPEEPALAK
ncbi:MAG TPA: adenosylmethionine decarboxylase [Ktedonobacterales bacterium]|nr:adenosylmethionine decarboxylase [Ktedonobacterales bacterium]